MNKFKKIVLGVVGVGLISSIGLFGIHKFNKTEPLAGGMELWRFISPSSIAPIVSTWHLGASANRIAKGWFTDLDSTTGTIGTLTISSTATGPLIVNGNIRASIGTAASPSFTFRTDQDTGMWMPASNSLAFSTFGVERLRIDSAGNIGIGTTTTSSALLNIGSGTPTTAANGFMFGTDTAANLYRSAASTIKTDGNIVAAGTASSSFSGSLDISKGLRVGANTGFTVQANAAANSLFIATGGNVGIGTTVPLTKFEVQGTASASNLLTVGSLQVANGGATVSYSRFGTSTTSHSNYISSNNDLLISGDLETIGSVSLGNSALTVTAGGNVGIGTTGPGSLFTVSGAQYLSTFRNSVNSPVTDGQGSGITFYYTGTLGIDKGGVLALGGTYTGTTQSDFAYIAGRKENATDGNTAGYFAVYTSPNGANPAERMRIDSAGNVGIGTTSPLQVLSVVGTIRQTGCTTSGTLSANTSGDIICTPSSQRFKHDITPLTDADGLAIVKALTPVSFVFNPNTLMGSSTQVGFIAEQANQVDPRLVSVNDATGQIQGFRYENYTAILTKAVQELDAKVSSLSLSLNKKSTQKTNKKNKVTDIAGVESQDVVEQKQYGNYGLFGLFGLLGLIPLFRRKHD